MEWANDAGLHGSDTDSDGGGYLNPPQTQQDQVPIPPKQARCRCAEQQGPCIYCRLGWLRAENDHSTAQATSDPRVVYAETAARQLEAQIAELGGRISTEVADFEPKHPSGAVSSPTKSSDSHTVPRRSEHAGGDDAPLPDWLVEMIQNPSEDSTSRSASPYRQVRGRGGGRNRGRGTAPRNHQQTATASDKAGRGASGTRSGTAGPLSSRVVASSRQQRPDSLRQQQRPAAQRGKSSTKTEALERSASKEQKLAQERAKSRPSDADENDASLEPQSQTPRSRPPSANTKDHGIGRQGRTPKSPAHHPRPWSPPSAGRSLHFAEKPTDSASLGDQDRERRRQATRLAKGATMRHHAKSRADSGRASSATRHEFRREADDTSAISDLVEELSRLRRENHALRGGEVSTELVRLRKETQSLRAELAEQKKMFRWQLSRNRQEKTVLHDQILSLHAEKRAGAWTAGAPAAGTQAGAQRHTRGRVARASSPARSVEFDIPGQRGSQNEGVGAELSPTRSPTLDADSCSDKVTVEETFSAIDDRKLVEE